jgi:hypothetical protein
VAALGGGTSPDTRNEFIGGQPRIVTPEQASISIADGSESNNPLLVDSHAVAGPIDSTP